MMRYTLMMLALLCGCASWQPPVLPHGEATRHALAMQVLDAEAGRGRERAQRPVDGLDGRSAASAQQRYQKSFGDAPQDNAPIMGKK
jgi:hypothetical protein